MLQTLCSSLDFIKILSIFCLNYVQYTVKYKHVIILMLNKTPRVVEKIQSQELVTKSFDIKSGQELCKLISNLKL